MSTEQGYANPAALVSTQWVADHLNDASVRLIEVDVDTSSYAQGHIAGAVGINWTTQLGDPIRRDIPSREDWQKLLGDAGVTNDTRIIFYGDNNNWFAAFAYWVSKIYGHQNGALMNGGRKKWEAEGRPYTTDEPRPAPTSYSASAADTSLRAFLQRRARPTVRYGAGRRALAGRVQRRGHRAARHDRDGPARRARARRGEHPMGPGRQRGRHVQVAAELKALYAGKGVTADKDVIAYCRIGERSSFSWFVLKELLGFKNVKNYDGSWTEYGSVIGVPIDNPAAKV